METNSNSLTKTARLAGLLYLIWIMTGLFAMFYVPSQINMRGDAATTAQNVLAKESLFRSSMVNEVISSTLWVFLVAVFYRMFRPVDEHQAKLLLAFVIVQIPAAFFMGACDVTALMLFKGEILKSFEVTQRQDLGALFLRINDYGTLSLQAFWGLWLFPLGILVYKSCFLPRFLGVWLIITGLFYVVLSYTSIMLPEHKGAVLNSVFALPAELGEVALMLWLLLKGAKQPTASGAPT